VIVLRIYKGADSMIVVALYALFVIALLGMCYYGVKNR
jgi:hypothetical protein